MAAHRSRSPHRLCRTLAACVLALPLVALPVVAPAAAAVDDRGTAPSHGYGAWSSGGPSYGLPYGGYGYGGDQRTQQYGATTATDTEPASASESNGVVLVDTVLDYGSGAAAGTGLVLSSDGVVATNHHVVEGATRITVTLPSGTSYTARLIGSDSVHDVALLQLGGASGLATVRTDKATVRTGEKVTSVGNAEGEGTLVAADGTVTDPSTGITVDEEDGSTAALTDLVQVDADVVSGDSGGALLDADGEVVGMNVAASSGSARITGYAIPISRVLDIAARILAGEESGDVEIGYDAALGVQLYDGSTPQVAGVVDGSAADTAGIAPGSTITSVDGTRIDSLADITGVLAQHRPGDRVRVAWTDAQGAGHSAIVGLGRAPIT